MRLTFNSWDRVNHKDLEFDADYTTVVGTHFREKVIVDTLIPPDFDDEKAQGILDLGVENPAEYLTKCVLSGVGGSRAEKLAFYNEYYQSKYEDHEENRAMEERM